MTIATFRDAYVRRYSDSGQITAYVEWTDTRGNQGRTEGGPQKFVQGRGRPARISFGLHMHALVNAAKRQGVSLRREVW